MPWIYLQMGYAACHDEQVDIHRCIFMLTLTCIHVSACNGLPFMPSQLAKHDSSNHKQSHQRSVSVRLMVSHPYLLLYALLLRRKCIGLQCCSLDKPDPNLTQDRPYDLSYLDSTSHQSCVYQINQLHTRVMTMPQLTVARVLLRCSNAIYSIECAFAFSLSVVSHWNTL